MNVAFTILVVLIVLAAILLIVVVLLQNGKDGGLATNFTSANQALGVRQTATILEKATWYLIGFILVLAIASTLVISHGSMAGSRDSVSSEILDEAAPAAETPAFPVEIPQSDPTQE
ncbi:MAG: preprotein translocase subunit SecG [Bacteroidales bacterium]|nr:preprotein translocase subunit SecG [Bacteroidales bacterium]